jgi:hypothetical protein
MNGRMDPTEHGAEQCRLQSVTFIKYFEIGHNYGCWI